MAHNLDKASLMEWLRPVQDPELFLSLVDLGLVYDCALEGDQKVKVKMTLTSPGCPAAGMLVEQVKSRLLEHEVIQEADVELVWEPRWDPHEMASEEAKEALGLW